MYVPHVIQLSALELGTLRATKSAWGFLGVNFWSRDFLGFCWKS